jgi:hypothetical protein
VARFAGSIRFSLLRSWGLRPRLYSVARFAGWLLNRWFVVDLVGDGPQDQSDLGVTHLRSAKLDLDVEVFIR